MLKSQIICWTRYRAPEHLVIPIRRKPAATTKKGRSYCWSTIEHFKNCLRVSPLLCFELGNISIHQKMIENHSQFEKKESGKRRRLLAPHSNGNSTSKSMSLCELVIDVLVHILHFLPKDDIDSFAIASKYCAETRNHLSLDQARRGSIVLNGSTTPFNGNVWNAETFLLAIPSRKWHEVFKGKRSRLKISGLQLLNSSKMTQLTRLSKQSKLDNVKSLNASFEASLQPPHRKVKNSVLKSLSLVLPNLRELDISYMKVTETAVNSFAKNCPNLEIFRWNGSDDGLRLSGINLASCKNLREIYLEDARLYCSFRRAANTPFLAHQDNLEALVEDILVLYFCSTKLERVSIKGSRWYSWDLSMSSLLGNYPGSEIPQNALVDFVQNAPSLKWFRSDLSIKNAATLRSRYPNISFSRWMLQDH